MAQRPVEFLLHHLPAVASKAENDWARNFSRSILRQARRQAWQPSPKQLGIMQRLVGELFTEHDPVLIEDDDPRIT